MCTSVNEVICHGIPDQYVLQDGDIVNIDLSSYEWCETGLPSEDAVVEREPAMGLLGR